MDESVCEPAETLDRTVLGQFREADSEALPDFARELIEQFVEEAQSQVDILRNAGQCGDARTVKSTAHCLKGSSLTIGAMRMGTLCGRVETYAADFAGGVSSLMIELDQEFLKVRHALAAER